MSFAILRHNKIKSVQKGPAIGHNHRLSNEAKVNIDPTKSGLNVFFDGEGTKDRIEAKLPSKRRKDAVVLIEILLTSGPEFFDAIEMDRAKLSTNSKFKEWVQASISWAKKEFGANLIDTVLHMDESTPHLHVLTVPLTHDGRLCAKELTMRAEMQRRQTDYARAMKQFGLERGTPAIETKRRHIGLKEAPGSGGKAALDAKAQADLLATVEDELERVKGELARTTAETRHAVAKATATATAEAQGALEKAEKALVESNAAMRNQQKLNIENFHLINKINDKAKKMDAYTKDLQAELAISNEKLAVALDEKAAALRALVHSGEKSSELLKTVAGHEAAAEQLRKISVMNSKATSFANAVITGRIGNIMHLMTPAAQIFESEKEYLEFASQVAQEIDNETQEAQKAQKAQEAQEAFALKWAGATAASPAERALRVVAVCGQSVVYAVNRGNFAIHTFEPGEVVPKLNLTEQQKNGIER